MKEVVSSQTWMHRMMVQIFLSVAETRKIQRDALPHIDAHRLPRCQLVEHTRLRRFTIRTLIHSRPKTHCLCRAGGSIHLAVVARSTNRRVDTTVQVHPALTRRMSRASMAIRSVVLAAQAGGHQVSGCRKMTMR